METSLLVLFGSQTGNAQDIAETLHRAFKKHKIPSNISSMNDYQLKLLEYQPIILFVCSTTGDGEEPENIKKFFRFLMRKSLPSTLLNHLEYAIIGLGDSTYNKFNYSAKKINRRLIGLGARPLLETCLADDSHPLGSFWYVRKWVPRFYSAIKARFHSSLNVLFNIDPTERPESFAYKIRWIQFQGFPGEKKNSRGNEGFSRGTMVSSERVTPDNHFQDVRLLRFISPELGSRGPGDVISVWAQNPPKLVAKMLTLLGRQENDTFEIFESQNSKFGEKRVFTVGQVFENYLDLNGIPRRSFFALFLQWARDDLERSRLAEFISDEGLDEFYEYCIRPRRNYYEVMRDFSKTTGNIPFEYILEIIPRLQPRDYSICSLPKKDLIDLLLVVVSYRRRGLVEPRIGTCSTWLASLQNGDEILIKLKKSEMVFGRHNIMVGPGTGVGVFRSFVGECDHENLLFFGCRNKLCDFYFESEWRGNPKLNLFAAFSRDQKEKEYVQHLIEANSELVWRFLSDLSATIIISGNAKLMPNSVREAFQRVICRHGDMSGQEADRFLQKMESSKRYQIHVWA